MPINAECPGCFRTYKVPDKFAGKKIRCKACGASVPVESESSDDLFFDDDLNDDDSDYGGWPPVAQTATPKRPAKKSSSGQMTLMQFGLPIAIIFFLSLLVMIGTAFTTWSIGIGAIMIVFAFLVIIAGRILMIADAFKEDSAQGVLVLLVPVYPLIYTVTRWPRTQRCVQLFLIAGVIILATPFMFVSGARKQQAANANQQVAERPVWVPEQHLNPPDFGHPQRDAGLNPREPFSPPVGHVPPPHVPNWGGGADSMTRTPSFGESETPEESEPTIDNPFRPKAGPVDPPDNPFRSKVSSNGPPESPFRPKGGNGTTDDDTPVTIYIHHISSRFDRDADHRKLLETELQKLDYYVPNSATLDLDAGTVSLSASDGPHSRLQFAAITALRSLGLHAMPVPNPAEWDNPTQAKRITLRITNTSPLLERHRDDLESKIDQQLSESHPKAYVSGSLKVDLPNERVSFERYPGESTIAFLMGFGRFGLHLSPEELAE